MADVQTRTGGCSCGAVRFEADMSLEGLLACNCSNCGKKGLILGFIPPEQFRLTAGENATHDYLFNKRVIHHQICKTCGTEAYARGRKPDGSDMVAVNARCIDDIDVAALNVTPFDGRSA